MYRSRETFDLELFIENQLTHGRLVEQHVFVFDMIQARKIPQDDEPCGIRHDGAEFEMSLQVIPQVFELWHLDIFARDHDLDLCAVAIRDAVLLAEFLGRGERIIQAEGWYAILEQERTAIKDVILDRSDMTISQSEDGVLESAPPHAAHVLVLLQSAGGFAIRADHFVHVRIVHALCKVTDADYGVFM